MFLVRGKAKAEITKGFVSLEEEGGGTAAAAVLLFLLVGCDYYWWIDKLCMGFGKLFTYVEMSGKEGGIDRRFARFGLASNPALLGIFSTVVGKAVGVIFWSG